MNKLPASFKQYFWDVDFEAVDPDKKPFFVIKRLIDRGDTEAVKWVLAHYPVSNIADLVMRSRDLTRKTANFWAKVLNIDPRKVPCLNKPYSRIPFGLSS